MYSSNRKLLVDRSIPRQNKLAPIENLGEYTTNILRITIFNYPPKRYWKLCPQQKGPFEKEHFIFQPLICRGQLLVCGGVNIIEMQNFTVHCAISGGSVAMCPPESTPPCCTTFLRGLFCKTKLQEIKNARPRFCLFVDFHGIYIPSQKVNGAFSVPLGWYP